MVAAAWREESTPREEGGLRDDKLGFATDHRPVGHHNCIRGWERIRVRKMELPGVL